MFYVLKLIAWLLSKCSDRSLETLCQLITVIGYDILRIRRRVIHGNLRIAFGDAMSTKERNRVARASFLNFVMTTIEFIRGFYIDFTRNVQIANADLVREVLDEGNGAFVLCMHMGNWEAMGASVSRLISPAHVIVKAVGSKQVDRFVEEVRKRNGFVSIKRTAGTHHVREVFAALKRGEIVGFVMDQSRPGEPRIPFFGTPAKTNTGLAVLVRKTKVKVIPGYAIRDRFSYHTVTFQEPLEVELSTNHDDDIKKLTLQFSQSLEQMIRKRPEQYFWLHKRWK